MLHGPNSIFDQQRGCDSVHFSCFTSNLISVLTQLYHIHMPWYLIQLSNRQRTSTLWMIHISISKEIVHPFIFQYFPPIWILSLPQLNHLFMAQSTIVDMQCIHSSTALFAEFGLRILARTQFTTATVMELKIYLTLSHSFRFISYSALLHHNTTVVDRQC